MEKVLVAVVIALLVLIFVSYEGGISGEFVRRPPCLRSMGCFTCFKDRDCERTINTGGLTTESSCIDGICRNPVSFCENFGKS